MRSICAGTFLYVAVLELLAPAFGHHHAAAAPAPEAFTASPSQLGLVPAHATAQLPSATNRPPVAFWK